MPMLRTVSPRANTRTHPHARLLHMSPQPHCQGYGHRAVQHVAQQSRRSTGHNRLALPAAVSAQMQCDDLRGPFDAGWSQHLPLPNAVTDQPQAPPQRSSRCPAAWTHSGAHPVDVGCPLHPKFDVSFEIRDALLASSFSFDVGRSKTGKSIGVGSPSPFLCGPAPCHRFASIPER